MKVECVYWPMLEIHAKPLKTSWNPKSGTEGETGAHLGGVQVLVDQAGNVILNTVPDQVGYVKMVIRIS